MKKGTNAKLVIILMSIIIVILAGLCVLFATGTISFKDKANDAASTPKEDNNEKTDNKFKPIVTIKSFEIDQASVINAPNNHLGVTGNFVLESNEDDYINISFYGYCIDVDGNTYEIQAPGFGVHKYEIGKNDLDAAEIYPNDYGTKYNLCKEESDFCNWKDIEFVSCKFNKMITTILYEDETIEISEVINYEKTF